MVFTSYVFLFYFLPVVLLIYYLLPRGRNIFLTLASYVFYGWWEPWFVLLMLLSTVLDYVCGGIIAAPGATERSRRMALTLAIVGDLSLLAFFKYYVFTAENLNRLLALFGASALPVLAITLPVGISFYTFESMSYTIDVYRGVVRRARSFADLACFVSLFPHLVAGPVVRYNVIEEQLISREHSVDKFVYGIGVFILGFAKKVLLANPMGTVGDAVFGARAPMPLDAWFGIVAYAFQIYFDFSGYSDMAVGLSRMFGFVIPKNFASPYLAESITDFWRRWHLSLSTWLRDYLYIPLGGNQRGPKRTYFNLAVVMILGGLWHGANWTFVLWGAFHGCLLAFERFLGKRTLYESAAKPIRIATTFVLVLFSWVLFRSPDLSHALHYFRCMFGAAAEAPSVWLGAEIYTPYALFIASVCALASFQPIEVGDWVSGLTWKRAAVLVPLFLYCVAVMFTQSFNPFLYFQF